MPASQRSTQLIQRRSRIKRGARKPRSVVEIGVLCTEGELRRLEGFLRHTLKTEYYLEPAVEPAYATLAELEADCEGK